MLVVMDKTIHEEVLYQPLQTNNKQYKIAVTFLTRFNGIFKVTNKNNKICFTVSISDDDLSVISIPLVALESESLNNEIKRSIIKEGYFTESNYPFTIEPNFSTLGSIIEVSSNITGSQIIFTLDDSIGDL